MSGLTTLGGSAIAGIGVVAAGPAAAATVATHHVLRDDPFLPAQERQARANGRRASPIAAITGTGGALALVSAAGVPGLSAVGVTTGLAAIGGTMLGGLLLVALLPAVAGRCCWCCGLQNPTQLRDWFPKLDSPPRKIYTARYRVPRPAPSLANKAPATIARRAGASMAVVMPDAGRDLLRAE